MLEEGWLSPYNKNIKYFFFLGSKYSGDAMLTVLNIDDSSIDFRLTKSQIVSVAKDIELIWADSGAKALEAIESQKIDCILCDYQMPDVNGIEFLLSLRQRKIEIPFIFFTGQGNETVAAEALRNGADDYFTKDIEFAQYERIVNSIKRQVISKKEKVKQATLEAEARQFKLISDHANHGNVILDKSQKIIYANQMFASMHGFDIDQVMGKKMKDFISPRNSGLIEELEKSLSQKGSFEARELWHLKQNGEEFPVILSAILVDDEEGKAENIVYTVMDISRRRETQQALEESEKNFRLLIEDGPIAYQSLDNQGRFINVNEVWLKMFGYKKEDVIGRCFVDFLTEEDADTFATSFEVFAGKGEIHNVKYMMVTHNGEVERVDISGRISVDSKGRFKQTNCVLFKDSPAK